MVRHCISETELIEYNGYGQKRTIWVFYYNDGTEESVRGVWL